jgi:hypothetical protein
VVGGSAYDTGMGLGRCRECTVVVVKMQADRRWCWQCNTSSRPRYVRQQVDAFFDIGNSEEQIGFKE